MPSVPRVYPWRNLQGVSGIYAITNTVNGKQYIGKAKNIGIRWIGHRAALRHHKHINFILQKAWDKYGEDAFTFTLLEELPNDHELLCARERHWALELRPKYNIARVNGYTANPRTASPARLLANERMRGKKLSPEVRAKMSASKKGRKWRPEDIAKRSATRRGRVTPPEVREKIAAGVRRFASDPVRGAAWRAMLSQQATGRKPSSEARNKSAVARIGLKQSPETIAKRMATMRQRQAERAACEPLVQLSLFPAEHG